MSDRDDDLEPELLHDEDPMEPEQSAPTSELALPQEVMPDTLYLLPVSERPFFPAQAFPVVMDEKPWIDTIEKIGELPQHLAGLVLVRSEREDRIRPDDFYSVGSVVRLHHPAHADGKLQFIAEGVRRFRIEKLLSRRPPYLARVSYPDEVGHNKSDAVRAYAMAIINTIKELLPLNPLYSEELKFFLNRFGPNDPSPLTDFAAGLTTADKGALQEVLETVPVLARMKKVLVLLRKEVEVAKLQRQIRQRVEERMSENQRRFFLKQQLKEIQQELGLEKDDRTDAQERFRERLGKLQLPAAAQQRIDEELEKLAILETGSPEYGVTRNYLDVVTALPWGNCTKDRLNLKRAQRILDRDHDGLEDVKKRIIEFLAVGVLKGEIAGSIVLLVGPPGVGKTSIGRSIADALGRKFYRFSLGGMRDEAEIKGHRRTYIGAMPGKFIQAIKESGSANPVIMLDELDKIGASYRGDPASALLEVLDPEQNSDFLDHYLDLRFDLSRVLFICTANQLDTIPGPLLDRMEVIRLSGYISEEKVAIAKHHLWPRQLQRVGLQKSQVRLSDAALRQVIDGYAREAGVRNLEKQLGRIARHAVVQRVQQQDEAADSGAAIADADPIRVTPKNLERFLGKPSFQQQAPFSGIGVVTGLAWTALGGATLNIEATRVHGDRRGIKLTGQLGEVMRESAEIAYSYITAHLADYGSDEDYFSKAAVHLHVPEGATPKDGPSAGITMASALLLLALDRTLSRPLAMTGELTLSGRVLAVGGIREKVIAARRNNVMELILPAANRGDFEELPDYIRDGITVHFADHYREVAPLL